MKKSDGLFKKIYIIFLLLFCSILFALLLGEFTVRKLKILDRKFDHLFTGINSFITPSDDEHLKYVLTPNFKNKIKLRRNENYNATYNTTYSINSLGLRGSEPRRNKDSINIIVIGDSISFGLGVADNYVYPVVLEKKLNAWAEKNSLPLDFEVYNCSVPGYNSMQEHYLCKDFVETTKARIVIWQYFYNDTWAPMEYAMGNLVWNFEQRIPSHLLFLLNSFLYRNKIYNDIGTKGVFTSLRSMAKITSDIDAKFISFIAPAVSQINFLDELKKESIDLELLLKSAPSEYIDILSVFDEYSSKDIQIRPNDDHWNRKGHELVADKLAKRIIKHINRERYKGGLKETR